MKSRTLFSLATLLVFAVPVAAQVNFKATPILQSGTTSVGGAIAYPRTDSAEVTALVLEIGPGGETGRHMHPTVAFVYVLEGEIVVEMDGGASHTYKAGDSFLEAINGWHNGKNTGTTMARVLVVFTGVKGKPNLVRPS